MKRFNRLVMAVLAVIVTATSAFSAVPAYAVDSSSLSIPPKKSYLIEPGKSVADTLSIRNLDSVSDLQLTLRVIDFSYTDESGTPKLFLDKDAAQTTWSLKPFLTVPKSVTIPAGSSKTLDMKVSIPEGQGAGSFYSAIVYSSGSGEGGNVGLSASGVTLVFVNIPGKVNENLQFKQLGVYNKTGTATGSGYQFASTSEPQTLGYTLINSGNVAESPTGQIKMKNLFFGQEVTVDRINPTGALALRGQTRLFVPCIKTKAQDVDFNGERSQGTSCVSPGLWPGLYSISADLFYGQNGNTTQEITKVAYFWYLPWWFVIVSLIVIALIVYFGSKLFRGVRRKLGYTTSKKQK